MDLEKKFTKMMERKDRGFAKLVQVQKRLFDEWALERLAENGYPDFKIPYLSVLMNLGLKGKTNNELSDMICVSKQAVSKVIKELEAYGLVMTEIHEEDARSSVIKPTKKGMEMLIKAGEEVQVRVSEYEKLVGKKRFHEALETMHLVLDYERSRWNRNKKKSF